MTSPSTHFLRYTQDRQSEQERRVRGKAPDGNDVVAGDGEEGEGDLIKILNIFPRVRELSGI